MSGLNRFDGKQHRSIRRRNHIAKDLYTPRYGPRIKELKKQHLVDEYHEQEAEEDLYEFYKELGLGTKE